MGRYLIFLLLLLSFPAAGALAQSDQSLPSAVQLDGFRFEYQGWNNCGPATLTNALTYFGYTDNQTRAAQFLKPNGEDKNVSPNEMIRFVNSQVFFELLEIFSEALHDNFFPSSNYLEP